MALSTPLPGEATATAHQPGPVAPPGEGTFDRANGRRRVSTPAMRKAASRVSGLASATEKAFLRAGASLERAISRFDRLSAPLAQLAAVADAGEFAQASADAAGLEERAALFAANSGPLLERIETLSAAAETLGTDLSVMRQVIRTMSIVALNARVTVATLAGQNSSLEVFTTAATAQVMEAGDTIGQITEAVEHMARRLHLASAEAGNLSHLLRRQLGPALAGLRLDMDAFEKDLTRTTADGSILMTHGDEFRRAVTTAVLSLQIGDTTRQRLEHVADMLDGTAAQETADGALARITLALAAAHLRDAHERHAAAIVTARSALRDLGQATAEIGRISGRVGTSPRHNLKQHLQQLQAILDECRTAQTRLVSVARNLSSGLAELLPILERMSGVEERMSMIGLNAVIACVQLGDEALALREISFQLRELASTSAERLGSITRSLSAMSDEAVITAVELEGPFKQDLHDLTGAGDRVFSLLSGIEAGILQTGATVERERRLAERDVATGIAALDGHSAAFADLLTMAPALERWANRLDGDLNATATGDALERVRAGYTMAAERLVHDLLLRDLGVTAAEEVSESTAPPADDILDVLF